MELVRKYVHSPAFGLFVVRFVAGVIFLNHGIAKLNNMEGTIAFFGMLGFGAFLAWVVALVETVGGVALILGYGAKFFSTLLAIIMIVAIVKVKIAGGLKGSELELMLLASALGVLFSGCGKYSVCSLFHSKKCDDCKTDGKCACQH